MLGGASARSTIPRRAASARFARGWSSGVAISMLPRLRYGLVGDVQKANQGNGMPFPWVSCRGLLRRTTI
jgi:hypothetical protein